MIFVVYMRKESNRGRPPESGRTRVAEYRLNRHPDYEPPKVGEVHGTFKGRPIIGHDTRINGGVYLGGGAREAIVVDDNAGGSTYLKRASGILQASIMASASAAHRRRFKAPVDTVLRATYDYTRQILPFDAEKAEQVRRQYPDDKKVSILKFIEIGGGVCRHQALLAGYFMETMIDQQIVDGQVHIERNTMSSGPHAWVRYTAESGASYVIDPSQNFVGSEEASKSAPWPYVIPE
jgi:hypothetical protein